VIHAAAEKLIPVPQKKRKRKLTPGTYIFLSSLFSLFQSACTVIGCLQRVVHGTENAHYQYEGGSDDVNDAIIDVKYRVDLATSPFVMSPRQS